jgi:hypothetical protein
MPDKGEQLTAPTASSTFGKSQETMQSTDSPSSPISAEKASQEANQKLNSSTASEMDRLRREKQQVQFRTPEQRVPTTVKSDVSEPKKQSLTTDTAGADTKSVNAQSGMAGGSLSSDGGQKAADESQNLKSSSPLPSSAQNTVKADSRSAVTNGDSTAKASSPEATSKSAASSKPSIDLDDATLAHRLWAYLQDKQLDLDDGRRAWTNAYYGVKKQAEELERKKTALENWRDQLLKLEEQLPIMEKQLEEKAETLYKRREEFNDKQKEMDLKRKEFYNVKVQLVEWSRTDDSMYDRMMDRKSSRSKRSIHPHPHHSHHGIPPPIGMAVHSNDWAASPISTPESQLDDYSYGDGLVPIDDMDTGSWTVPMGGVPSFVQPKGGFMPHMVSAGPSGTSKKGKKGKLGAGPPPPPPPGLGTGNASGSSTSLASSIPPQTLPLEESTDGAQVRIS